MAPSKVKLFGIIVAVLMITQVTDAGRYKSCSDGCCPHEYCANGQICYPSMRCRYGCPDGDCVDNSCIPHPQCDSNYDCDPGNICTTNYNLGYNTCQYNLDIGSTLCYKTSLKRALLAQDEARAEKLVLSRFAEIAKRKFRDRMDVTR